MKQILTLFLSFLLLCTTLTPVALAEGSISGTDTIVLTSFDEPYRTDAVAFALNTSQEELSKWFSDVSSGFTGYDSHGNIYDVGTDTWHLENVNTGTVGVYYAYALPNLGTEYKLAEGISMPRQLCAVSIQALEKPDINCCVSGRGFLHFPWVLSAKQVEHLDEFAVWLRQDNGEWTQLSDGFLFISDGLQLSQRILKYGNTYDLKVTYLNGQTGVLTFKYDMQLSILDYSSGDRDGGDVNSGGSGTGSQPIPTQSQTSSSSNDDDYNRYDSTKTFQDKPLQESNEAPIELAPALSEQISTTQTFKTKTVLMPKEINVPVPQEKSDTSVVSAQNQCKTQKQSNYKIVNGSKPISETATKTKPLSENASPIIQESFSPTQTVISGLRLRDLCKDEESVVFGSGDLTASIPSMLLSKLNLSDFDTLSVKLTQPQNNQIVLAVEVSEKPVMELTGTKLRLRYMPLSENAEIIVQNELGKQITSATYDGEFLCFAADISGTYTTLDLSNTQKTQTGVPPLFPISGGLILAIGVIVFLRNRRHG